MEATPYRVRFAHLYGARGRDVILEATPYRVRFAHLYGARGRGVILEATGGIEPPHKGFADLSLTTWVRGQ